MKQVVLIALLLSGISFTSAESDEIQACRDMLRACQRWCYANRSGPDMSVCKSNCQSKFTSSLSSGVFRWQDGAEVPCQAVPGVVWRENTLQTVALCNIELPALH